MRSYESFSILSSSCVISSINIKGWLNPWSIKDERIQRYTLFTELRTIISSPCFNCPKAGASSNVESLKVFPLISEISEMFNSFNPEGFTSTICLSKFRIIIPCGDAWISRSRNWFFSRTASRSLRNCEIIRLKIPISSLASLFLTRRKWVEKSWSLSNCIPLSRM